MPPATAIPPSATRLPALANDLLAAMGSIRRSGRRVAARPVELSALTGAQLDLVRLIGRRPGVSVTRAADELGLAGNTVSTLVRQLTDAGLLVRRADDTDRRVARLELTDEMARTVGALRDRRVAVLSAGMAALSPADQARLADAVDVLRTLADTLSEGTVADA
jgi:DNA-binding MarR family transcriptional regulator